MIGFINYNTLFMTSLVITECNHGEHIDVLKYINVMFTCYLVKVS
jgi:hypothetical protein